MTTFQEGDEVFVSDKEKFRAPGAREAERYKPPFSGVRN